MKKTLFFVFMTAFVAAALAGGTAFILRQGQHQEYKRLAAQAEEHLNTGNYEQAIPMLKKVEARGGTARSAFLLGKIYFMQGKYEVALPYFSKVLDQFKESDHAADALLYQARHKLDVMKDKTGARDNLLTILSKHPNTVANDHALVLLARISLEQNNEPQAKKALDTVIRRPDSPAHSDAEFLLGDLNMKALKSPDPAIGDEVYTIKKGDTLWGMERKLKVPADLLIGINGLNPNALTVGTQIKVPRLNISLVIDKAQRTLTVRNNNTFLKKYRVGINQDESALPPGEYSVTAKHEKGYEWTDPATNATVKPGDPANPYGSKFISLRRELGIHGTTEPDKVGGPISKGTVAMRNEDVQELYALVQIKPATPVSIKGRAKSENDSAKR